MGTGVRGIYEEQLRQAMEGTITPNTFYPSLTQDPFYGGGTSNVATQDTLTASIPVVEDYKRWYKEMRKELTELKQTNETILKLLAEVLDK